jgi:hypothetical protein
MKIKKDENEAICKAYLDALRAVHGDEIADETRCDYDKGWFYIDLAQRFSDGSIGTGGGIATAYRKNNVLEMTEELTRRAQKEV